MTSQTPIPPAGTASVSLELTISAAVTRVWKHMIEDIAQWWRADYLVCEDTLGMSLDPRPGGLLCERTKGGGFVWGQILSFQPDKVLSFLTHVVPPWGGPALTVVQIVLAPGEAGTTTLTLTDSVIGHVTEETLTNMEQGWRQLLGEGGLESFVESQGAAD